MRVICREVPADASRLATVVPIFPAPMTITFRAIVFAGALARFVRLSMVQCPTIELGQHRRNFGENDRRNQNCGWCLGALYYLNENIGFG